MTQTSDRPTCITTLFYLVLYSLVDKNEVETNIKLLEPDYCLSFVPTEKSYMIHLYDFGWKDETSDLGGHLVMTKKHQVDGGMFLMIS